jgi:hypothetical protein
LHFLITLSKKTIHVDVVCWWRQMLTIRCFKILTKKLYFDIYLGICSLMCIEWERTMFLAFFFYFLLFSITKQRKLLLCVVLCIIVVNLSAFQKFLIVMLPSFLGMYESNLVMLDWENVVLLLQPRTIFFVKKSFWLPSQSFGLKLEKIKEGKQYNNLFAKNNT